MKKLLKPDMSWVMVMIIAVVSAVVTAFLNCIPALASTSFTAPAETLELWVVLAVYIIMNCKSRKDAVLKTFVFFLVSQLLIYLFEVPFKAEGWGIFRYYPFWGVITVLTIPGAAIAYRVKKGDVISALILSVANFLLILNGLARIDYLVCEFPRHLISLVFCLVFPFVFIFSFLKEKRSRIVAVVTAVIMVLVCTAVFVFFPPHSSSNYPLDEENCKVTSVSKKGIDVMVEGDDLLIESHHNGDYSVTVETAGGELRYFEIKVEGATHVIDIRELQMNPAQSVENS